MPVDPWHPCDDGLAPIIEALERFLDIPMVEFPERVQSLMTSPSNELATVFNEPGMGPRRPFSRRREMVRRWLQSSGFVADSKEFDKRIQELFERLREWEQWVRTLAGPGKTVEDLRWPNVVKLFSDNVREAYDNLTDEASDLADYLKQLSAMIRARLARNRSEDGSERGASKTSRGDVRPPGVRGEAPVLGDLDDPILVAEIIRTVGRKAGRSDKLADKMKRRNYHLIKVGGKWHCQRKDALAMFPHNRQRIQEI